MQIVNNENPVPQQRPLVLMHEKLRLISVKIWYVNMYFWPATPLSISAGFVTVGHAWHTGTRHRQHAGCVTNGPTAHQKLWSKFSPEIVLPWSYSSPVESSSYAGSLWVDPDIVRTETRPNVSNMRSQTSRTSSQHG